MNRDINAPHFHYTGDLVQRTTDWTLGDTMEHSALYALIRWHDGTESEVEQGDPSVLLVVPAHKRDGTEPRPWEDPELVELRQQLKDAEDELADARAELEDVETRVCDLEWEADEIRQKIAKMERTPPRQVAA